MLHAAAHAVFILTRALVMENPLLLQLFANCHEHSYTPGLACVTTLTRCFLLLLATALHKTRA